MPFYYDHSVVHDNAFLRFVRKIYRPLGFYKGYNFPLWVIFGGAMFGFGCARLEYFDINGTFREAKIINGDWEYWQGGHYHIGIILHLVGVIPICLLVPWQFLPIVRHAAMLFHRLNGYLTILLLLIGNAGAFMIVRHQMGGTIEAQVVISLLGIYTTVGIFLAYYNIKRLQIDQHRAWMLRTWFAAAGIISQRIIMLAVADVITNYFSTRFFQAMPCRTINYVLTYYTKQPNMAARIYPACAADPQNGWAAVQADMSGRPEQIGASLNNSFGISGVIAFFLHIGGCELYLHLTSAERDRLKQVSYEKQLARGMKRPGDAGLTGEMWGDCREWHPATTQTVGRHVSDMEGVSDDDKRNPSRSSDEDAGLAA